MAKVLPFIDVLGYDGQNYSTYLVQHGEDNLISCGCVLLFTNMLVMGLVLGQSLMDHWYPVIRKNIL